MKKAVVLIGHGGVPRDFPRDQIGNEAKIRAWPRTPDNDPFYFGMELIRRSLEPRVGVPVVLAFNEFCAPSIEDAVADLVSQGFTEITLLTTMFTPGGVHSEIEIPEIAHAVQKQYPGVKISYPWPFDLNQVADLLAMQSGGSCTTQQSC